MLLGLLKFLGVEVVDNTYEGISKRQADSGCSCCTNALADGYECICKEDQVVELGDGTEHRFRTRQECGDWDCSYCH